MQHVTLLLAQLLILPLVCTQGAFINSDGNNNDAYAQWLATTSYDKNTFLSSTTKSNSNSSSSPGVAVHWSIRDDMIYLAVAAQVMASTGWAAFGLAESGSMRGADIVMYRADTNTITDSYVLDQLVVPITDKCQSWELINSVVDGGYIIFEAKRLLDTEDTQDRAIIDDSSSLILPTRVIAAWGDSSEPSYHGQNVARGTIRFFGADDMIDENVYFTETMAIESQGNFTIGANNYIIPIDVTTYQLFCYSHDDLLDMGVPLDQDLHSIGFEMLLQAGSEQYIHHVIAYASHKPWNNTLPCTNEGFNVLENAYGWAPGDLPLVLPSNVGSPLGINGYKSFALEIHYNNVQQNVNVSDSSGVRIYYTNIKREHDLGIFQVGDPTIGLRDTIVSPSGGLVQHSFTCVESCLQQYLTQPVTVIKEHLHMHKTGVSMVNYHIRNEQIIRQAQVDFWDFDQQGQLGIVQQPYQMNPGDKFQTVCNYNTTDSVTWGLGGHDEMCVAFLYYYPRQSSEKNYPILCGIGTQFFLPQCYVQHDTKLDLTTYDQIDRIFGSSQENCPLELPSSQKPVDQGSKSSASLVAISTVYINGVYLLIFIGLVLT